MVPIGVSLQLASQKRRYLTLNMLLLKIPTRQPNERVKSIIRYTNPEINRNF